MFSTPAPEPLASAHTYSFATPLFPDHIQLLLDLSTRTAVLLYVGKGESVLLLRSQQLTFSGAKVLLAILQAYPKHCDFEKLFACLDLPQPRIETMYGNGHGTDWELAIRPVRRAIATLTPILPAFGLQMISLRNKGYLLTVYADTLPAVIRVEGETAIPFDVSRLLQQKLPEQGADVVKV